MAKKLYSMAPTDISFYESAPIRFDNSIEIPVAPAIVWKMLEDDHSWTVWAGVIDKVEWTSSKPFNLGTTRTVTMAKGLMTGWETFIAWEEGKRMGFCFTDATMDGINRFAEDWHVTPTGPSSCTVRWVMCMEPTGINTHIIKAFSPIMTWNFKRYLKKLSQYAQKEIKNPKFSA